MDSVRIQLGMLSMLTNQADELSRHSQVIFKINKITSELFVKLMFKNIYLNFINMSYFSQEHNLKSVY
jgi:hypothetical protein